MYGKFGQFIDGKWQKSSSGETYEVINPANEEIIGKASKANKTLALVFFEYGVTATLSKKLLTSFLDL